MKFTLKESYERKINNRQSWGDEKNLSHERKRRGIREVKNIFKLNAFFLDNKISLKENVIKKNKLSLIDIGCGDKYIRFGCNHYGIGYQGIDYSDCDIEKEKLDFPDESFDIVVSMALIEHLKDPSNLLNESYRVLKKNGIFLISTPNWNFCMRSFYDDPTHIHPYTHKSLKRLLDLSPFSSVKVIPNLRCADKSDYIGFAPYLRAAKLRPFPNLLRYKFLPSFLKGKALGLFGIGTKLNSK